MGISHVYVYIYLYMHTDRHMFICEGNTDRPPPPQKKNICIAELIPWVERYIAQEPCPKLGLRELIWVRPAWLAPRAAQERPGVAQDGPRASQERPRAAEERPRAAQERPRAAQERSEGHLGGILARFRTFLEGKIIVFLTFFNTF